MKKLIIVILMLMVLGACSPSSKQQEIDRLEKKIECMELEEELGICLDCESEEWLNEH